MAATVLCAANSYTEKYYFNEQFAALPESVQQELKVLCVLFVEDVGGVLTLEFSEEGSLQLGVSRDDADYLFDEIGSELKIRQVQREKKELLRQLEVYYRVFFLHQDPATLELDWEESEDEESEEA